MKILSLSLDSKIIDKEQSVLERMDRYSEIVDQYTLIVADERKKQVDINKSVSAYGSGGSGKISKFFHVYFLASKLLRENDFDVVTTQNPLFVGFVGSLLKKKYGVKLELQFHSRKETPNWLLKYNLKQTDSIRVVSERIKNHLVDKYDVESKIITVVPIIVKEKINNFKNDYKADTPFVFLSVQRLEDVKNVSLQIKALKHLKEKGLKAKLLIAGDGEKRNQLKEMVKNNNLEDTVEFLGWLPKDKLDGAYTGSDCYLLTSDSEGWGRTAVEAAGRGLPIIMTDVGCAGEFIKDGQNGLLVDTNDLKNLEKTMKEIMEDQNLRKKLGKNARESYKNLPNEQEILQKYLQSWKKPTS